MMRRPSFLTAFLLIYCSYLNVSIRAEIISYDKHVVYPLKPQILPIAKFEKSEVPSWSPGKGRSYIDMAHLEVRSTCDSSFPKDTLLSTQAGSCEDTKFEVLMFQAPTEKPWKSYWPDNKFCCVDGSSCKNPGTLIVPSGLPGPYHRQVTIKANESPILFAGEDEISHHDIQSSGLYVIIFALCDGQAKPVYLYGDIDSIDPYGYLPADQFGNLPFYFWLSVLYVIVGVTWLILCVWYSDQLMPLQLWISAVIMIGALETTLLFFGFIVWNDFGSPATVLSVLGGFFGVVKRSLSRVLIQLVCLGYGVVRPSLGEEMGRVLYLGAAYFLLSSLYILLNGSGHTSAGGGSSADDPAVDLLSLVVFALAVVDSTFYIWIFTSINNLIVSLASRQQGVKFLLYKNFRAVLFSLLFFTCLWTLYSSVVFLRDTSGSYMNWKERWTVDALWELIYYIIFVAIAVLWAPSRNAQRYAHSMELSQLDDDSEWQSVQAAVEMTGDATSLSGVISNPAVAGDGEIDSEYGGRLQDEKDPFQGTGALDPLMAISKKA